ncbi:DNA-3-methyladenine glycosylase [Kribbella antibiotica]|uniref:Putative 3-methyladenine DNA glycosylase n=1 Tax=Kribbella antibiotica TaxID=190195 RepID=A0A4R4ZHZ7_9ACTN|nr:DNA-3-methyladenine glycosylase [Kribbella antibiotica]TDD58065.1 DNA-3-methyladenine glycosylase [Kribbella antibiotica]
MRRKQLAGPVLDVAPLLLGAVFRHTTAEGTVAVRITEVEAYDGPNDPGSHAYRGETPRNAVMFGPPGHLYVYFTYGMHFCMNVVTGPAGTPSAVLLRAGEVIEGVELARTRRAVAKDRDLARGPARLCVALGINREQNAVDLLARDSPVRLLDGPGFAGTPSAGPRVGLREAPDWPWRFWIPDDPTVSPYRPHVPKRRT